MPWYVWIMLALLGIAMDLALLIMVCKAIDIREQKGK